MRSKKRVLFLLVTVLPSLPLAVMALFWLQQHASCPPRDVKTGRDNLQSPLRQMIEIVGPAYHQGTDTASTHDDDIDPKIIRLSETHNIDERGKFQQKRVSEMCRKYVLPREQKLPVFEDLKLFFRHLMFDDKRKAIFCFVPKIGCTDMKRLMLYMGGQLPLKTVDWPWVEDSVYLEPALSRASLMNKTLVTNEKVLRLKTYYKFMIVRNPLERLVSAFRNKIESPLSRERLDRFPQFLKVEILEQYRSSKFRQWKSRTDLNISVAFSEFVQYFIETDVMKMNEHFRPSIDICHPCLIKYDFYGNFKNYSSDVAQLIDKFGTSRKFYRDKSLHSSSEQTDKKMALYYDQLSYRDKARLLGKLYDDLLFYYTLYPSERHSHYHILGLKLPVM